MDQKPLTPEEFERLKAELNRELEEAEREIAAGHLMTAEEFKAEMRRFLDQLESPRRKRRARPGA